MTTIEIKHTIQNKTPTDCFNAACLAYPRLGFTIWKKREIAWLVLAKKKVEAMEIDSNLSARPGNPTSINISVSSEKLAQDEINDIGNQILTELIKFLTLS